MPKVKTINLGVEERIWRAEDDLRCYLSWKQIEKDPARYRAVQKLAKERVAELEAVTESKATNDHDEDDD